MSDSCAYLYFVCSLCNSGFAVLVSGFGLVPRDLMFTIVAAFRTEGRHCTHYIEVTYYRPELFTAGFDSCAGPWLLYTGQLFVEVCVYITMRQNVSNSQTRPRVLQLCIYGGLWTVMIYICMFDVIARIKYG